MKENKRKSDIQSLVESFLNNSVSAENIMNSWPEGAPENLQEERLIHEIGHFIDDADIRAKDTAQDPADKTYENYQLDLIRKHLAVFLKS